MTLEAYLKLVKDGVAIRRVGDELKIKAPDKRRLTPAIIDELKADKPRVLSWVDPRPDIEEDSSEWQETLQEAARQGQVLWGLLHSLRCAGVGIRMEGKRYRLDCREIEMDIPDLREKWLMPHRAGIQAALNIISKKIEGESSALVS